MDSPPQVIAWNDFPRLGWLTTSYGQYEYSSGPVSLTLLEPDFGGRAQLIAQVVTDRKMSQRTLRFPLPIEGCRYNEAIEMIEVSAATSLAQIKWHA